MAAAPGKADGHGSTRKHTKGRAAVGFAFRMSPWPIPSAAQPGQSETQFGKQALPGFRRAASIWPTRCVNAPFGSLAGMLRRPRSSLRLRLSQVGCATNGTTGALSPMHEVNPETCKPTVSGCRSGQAVKPTCDSRRRKGLTRPAAQRHSRSLYPQTPAQPAHLKLDANNRDLRTGKRGVSTTTHRRGRFNASHQPPRNPLKSRVIPRARKTFSILARVLNTVWPVSMI